LKNAARFAVFFAVTLLFLLSPLSIEAVTTDLELVGDALGLVLEPPGGQLFDLGNMNPGDTRTAKITIENNYTDWYDLWMQARDATAEEPSLFEVMKLTVLYRGELLYSGPVQDFAAGRLHLGRFRPGESGEMVLTVHLYGPGAGNEYQGKSAGVKWIFTAQASKEIIIDPEDPGGEPEEPDKPDKPGELPRTYGAVAAGSLLGGLALLAGFRLVRKRNRR